MARWSIPGATAATARRAGYAPAAIAGTLLQCTCRFPGPTLIVTEGQTVTVTLTNNLPAAAGNTSILFPGFQRDDVRRRRRAC